jgi:hypothetical protein
MKVTKILDVKTDSKALIDEIAGLEAYSSESGGIFLADLSIVPDDMSVHLQQRLVSIIQMCGRKECTYFRFINY